MEPEMMTGQRPSIDDQFHLLKAGADCGFHPMVAFAQRLIQTPSLSGDEQAIARLTVDEMKALGYDDVWIDRAGNAIAVIRGSGDGPSVQFNAHMDHVSAGDQRLWAHPPFDATIAGDVLYGRGASDVKGAMATQVYLRSVLKDAGLRPAGDVFVVGVVLEEVGGFGSEVIAIDMPTTYAVLAEATNNQLNRGHRGRVGVKVTFTGLASHASAPERARNPHYAAARLLLAIEDLPMPQHATFGSSTVAPTLIEVDHTSANVTPGTLSLSLDWRSVPGETTDEILATLQPHVDQAAASVEGITASIETIGRPVQTYTGLSGVMPPTKGFETPEDHPLVQRSRAALEQALERPVVVGTWTFATDGGHLSHHGITTIGFAPGEERFAHTVHDQISLSKMREALLGNAALALAITAKEMS